MTLDNVNDFLTSLTTRRSNSSSVDTNFTITSDRDVPTISSARSIVITSACPGYNISTNQSIRNIFVESRWMRYTSVPTWFRKWSQYVYNFHFEINHKLFVFHEGGITYIPHFYETSDAPRVVNRDLFSTGINLVCALSDSRHYNLVIKFNPIIFSSSFEDEYLKKLCNRLKTYYKMLVENYNNFINFANLLSYRSYSVAVDDINPYRIVTCAAYDMSDESINNLIISRLDDISTEYNNFDTDEDDVEADTEEDYDDVESSEEEASNEEEVSYEATAVPSAAQVGFATVHNARSALDELVYSATDIIGDINETLAQYSREISDSLSVPADRVNSDGVTTATTAGEAGMAYTNTSDSALDRGINAIRAAADAGPFQYGIIRERS